jgi:hypothetical protein
LKAKVEEDIGFTGMVSLCTNLLAVALREVHNPATHRGQGNKRAGTGMPQLRVQTLVFLHSCNGRSICFVLKTRLNTEISSGTKYQGRMNWWHMLMPTTKNVSESGWYNINSNSKCIKLRIKKVY